MLPSPLLRQQQATLLALLSCVCSKYHFQVRISKLPLETALQLWDAQEGGGEKKSSRISVVG